MMFLDQQASVRVVDQHPMFVLRRPVITGAGTAILVMAGGN